MHINMHDWNDTINNYYAYSHAHVVEINFKIMLGTQCNKYINKYNNGLNLIPKTKTWYSACKHFDFSSSIMVLSMVVFEFTQSSTESKVDYNRCVTE